ncbi:hypothetical protein RchiOBHm_Chr2g0163721 [Rosa chinensis]|uniref:Uncharacterized protein n=1 Tax=Rosa chinensis TaxID=74649 RepID=A0A2P6S3E4_ROSCH|nr:hypothetical protein RchiOBHm_Chr2g0163721 [Rosa chinensis]
MKIHASVLRIVIPACKVSALRNFCCAAQREKIVDKQYHSLIEQLEAKQAQAEGLVGEIHLKEMELERLNGLWRKLESSNNEMSAARNRFGRSTSERGICFF